MIRPWKLLASRALHSCRVFSLRQDRYASPRTQKEHDFYLIDSPDWVNVIPLTAENRVVLVRQFRFGTREFSLEIPGGMLDPGDSPAEAARRELLEETGFAGEQPVLLGVVHPNPALHTNRCHTYLVRNAAFRQPPRPDSTEEIEVRVVPLSEVPRLISGGEITHALVIAAFYWLFQGKGELEEKTGGKDEARPPERAGKEGEK